VRIRAALTCGTDLKIARRGHAKFPFPLTLGHEWAGVVEKAGPGAGWASGTRVTGTVSAPCGACPACAEGRGNFCSSAFAPPLFGAFADFLLVPAASARTGLRRIPEGMADETAALLDPLASVVRGLKRAGEARNGDVLVVGTGPIAAMMFFLLRRASTRRIVVAGRREERLRFFAERGASVARIPPPPPGAFSLVVDTTGDAGVVEALPAIAADGGTVLLFAGLPAGARVAVDAGAIHYREVSVVGSFHYTPGEADEALALLASGAIPVAEIVSAHRPLAEWESAFALVQSGAALKVALVP
jgi:L-iditol 2-dehydrogenase